MTESEALLIGVPVCNSRFFEPIQHVVDADLRRMEDALAQSGYAVSRGGSTFNDINHALKKAFREAPADGTLIVYYSGHGVVVDGRSYLVPSDAYDDGETVDPAGLVPLFPPGTGIESCAARTIVFFIDACRNDLSGALHLPAGGDISFPPHGAVVMVNSCSAGERSGFANDGSHFTHALADALDRSAPARTVKEVIDETSRQLARRAALSDGETQTPTYAISRSGSCPVEPTSVEICLGDQVAEGWRAAVDNSPLWQRSSAGPADTAGAKEILLGVIGSAAQHWLESRTRLAELGRLTDNWSAQDFPVRVLARLNDLLPVGEELTLAEIVCAVATPFLREVALDAGLVLAAGIKPHDFTRTYATGPRSDLEITHDMHEHVWRRADGLARRDRLAARDALAMWLVHRWIAGRDSLWDDPAVADLAERIATAGADADSGLTARELHGYLRTLMRCVDGDLDDGTVTVALRGRIRDRRLRTLGGLLWLAGVLAADPRRMPSIVVDHIGVTDGLALSSVHEATRRVHWLANENRLALRMPCDHPALFSVFEGMVRRAERVRQALTTLDLDPALNAGLPMAVTDDLLRPEVVDGEEVFDTPVLRFRLSDEKVRELLMGRQLYGDPELAVRELYQNALDACRYRRVRRRYLASIGHETTPWEGRITIEQGVENGRAYIECSDNGIGMSDETLKSTFTNAGERFVYRPAFRTEHARWQEQDPSLELIPNSQFGVGVFSYFMIAEEIAIWTWPTNEEDVPAGNGFAVRIASSGSLFQISTGTRPAGGGTIVRLYLTEDDPVSALKTMRRLLHVAEFPVSVSDGPGPAEVWEPEQLKDTGTSVTPLPHGDDFWWVAGDGGLIADGISTSEERFGMVVNLRGRRRPRFTVNRNRLHSWNREWVDEQIEGSLPRLADWPGLTFNWLWNITDDNPAVGEKIFIWLVEHDHRIPVEGSASHGVQPSVARIGCLPLDRGLFNGSMSLWGNGHTWLKLWRAAAWRGAATFDFSESVALPESLRGFPLVSPLDAAVLGDLYPSRYYRGSWLGRPDVGDLVGAAIGEDESPQKRMSRLRRYAITGLDLKSMRALPPVRHIFRDKDDPFDKDKESSELFSAVAAWMAAGTVPARGSGIWLAEASMNLRAPIAEVVARSAALVPPGWEMSAPGMLAELGQYTFGKTELESFSRDVDGRPPWVDPEVPPSHLVRVSAKQGRPVSEILSLYTRLAPLGFRVIKADQIPQDLQAVEHDALSLVDSLPAPVSNLQLALWSARHGETVRVVRDRLQRLCDAGFLRLSEWVLDTEEILTDSDVGIVRDQAMNFSPSSDDQRLLPAGVAFLLIANRICRGSAVDLESRIEDHALLLECADTHRAITLPEIMFAAYYLEESVGKSIELYQKLLPRTADVSELPAAAFGCDLRPNNWETVSPLVNLGRVFAGCETELGWALTPFDIARAANYRRLSLPALLDMLEPYRDLDVPLPKLDTPTRERLAGHTVDRYDVSILRETDDAGAWVSVPPVTALKLVQTAGRLGWTLRATYERFDRFTPVGLDLRVDPGACDDDIVYWQDLLVITAYLDGQEPVIQGVVSDDHVNGAAAEIGETADQVRARLARYAGLLGFRLAPSV